MKLLDRYRNVLRFKVKKPKDFSIAYIRQHVKDCIATGDTLQIRIKPTFFDTTAGRGVINLTFTSEESEGQTVIKAEIVPSSFTQEGIYIFGCFLILWTAIFLLLSFTLKAFLMNIGAWIAVALFIHFTQVLNQGKLENEIIRLVGELKKSKENSVV